VPLLYPLLLQSLGVGLGVGVGATLRVLDRVEYAIALQALSLVLITPIGYILIDRLGVLGGAWFHGLRYLALSVGAVGVALRLLRPAQPATAPVRAEGDA
jgi:hypothetical protein